MANLILFYDRRTERSNDIVRSTDRDTVAPYASNTLLYTKRNADNNVHDALVNVHNRKKRPPAVLSKKEAP